MTVLIRALASSRERAAAPTELHTGAGHVPPTAGLDQGRLGRMRWPVFAGLGTGTLAGGVARRSSRAAGMTFLLRWPAKSREQW